MVRLHRPVVAASVQERDEITLGDVGKRDVLCEQAVTLIDVARDCRGTDRARKWIAARDYRKRRGVGWNVTTKS